MQEATTICLKACSTIRMFLVLILLSLGTVNTLLLRETVDINSDVSFNDHAQNIENHAPEVSVGFLSYDGSGQPFLRFYENSQVGDVLAYMKVQDRDTGNNGLVVCYTHSKYIKLSKDTSIQSKYMYYKISVNHVLDREWNASDEVTLTCTDHGNPPMSGSVSFLIVAT